MDILFFSSRDRGLAKILKLRLISECRLMENHIFRTIQNLQSKLALPMSHRPALVLFLRAGEIESLLDLKYVLNRCRVLIVLDQADPSLICQAHTLHPRFLTHADQGGDDIVTVIQHLIKKTGS